MCALIDEVARRAGVTPHQAAAVVRVLREPGDDMLEAGVAQGLGHAPSGPGMELAIWRAMIDHLLSESALCSGCASDARADAPALAS